MYPYPTNIGQIIPVNLTEVDFKAHPFAINNTIFTVYGLPSTGKGTLSTSLAKVLGQPVFDTGLLYRVFTYFMLKKKYHEVTPTILSEFKLQVQVLLIDNQVKYKLYNQELMIRDLRSTFVDQHITDYPKLPIVRTVVNELIAGFVQTSSFVTDGRGAYDGYLMEAEGKGVKIVRILLQAEQPERIRRRFIDYVQLERGHDLNSNKIAELWKTCEEIVQKRDAEEIDKDTKLGLGMISDDSGVLDTTDLSISEALDSVLNWLGKK